MHQVFLGIGGNTGNKHYNFDKVYTFIKNELGDIITIVGLRNTAVGF